MGLALGTNLKTYASVAKKLKLKVRIFGELIPSFVEVTGEKMVGRTFLPPLPLPSWIRLKEWDKAFVSTCCIKNLTLVSRINISFPSFLALNHFWSCLKVNIKIKNNVNLWFPKSSCHNFCVKILWSWLQKGITRGNHHEDNYYHFRDGVQSIIHREIVPLLQPIKTAYFEHTLLVDLVQLNRVLVVLSNSFKRKDFTKKLIHV